MSKKPDLVLKGGTIVDGSGTPGRVGDVAVAEGRIVSVGPTVEPGDAEVIDADGALVAPGWVDVHTHFDGQVTWDDTLDPSFSNGVTSLVMGNCGVGFAPCKPGDEQTLIELMEGVEDIPGTALSEGVPWGAWESFGEYLDFLGTRSYALDVGAQIAHGALRFYVMGERGVNNEDATPADIAEMRRLTAEAVEAGALGFSTSRTIFHRAIDGTPVPGTYASAAELTEIAAGMADGGGAVLEAISSESIGAMEALGGERFTAEQEMALLADISRSSGQPVTFTTVQNADWPDAWRDVLRHASEQNAAGAKLYPQVGSRPVGLLCGLGGYHPFMLKPAYREMAHLPVAERAKAMADPDLRARIMTEPNDDPESDGSMEMFALVYERLMPIMFPVGPDFDYEPTQDQCFAAIAQRRGVSVEDAMYDFLIADGGTQFCTYLGANFVEGSLDPVYEMLAHPETVTGLADAGAHVKLICDGTMPTTQLKHWTQSRTRGDLLPVELIVHKQTRRNAELYGLTDRGLLAPGLRADINVIDLDNLSVAPPVAHDDLPAGGWRLLQPVTGYLATVVAGRVTRRNDTDTGARPGRLARS
ncbi:MAG: amidohydrolase family protein [Acidimicrobiales bacterium]|nr:amidohydrolase family protein [Acidimicrobiales bacterium]